MTSASPFNRLGKIARLPQKIRHQLNQRLADNEPHEPLVRWLNALPEVQTVLQDLFAGRPISSQNLSAWKLGGYRDWERHQQTCARTRDFREEAQELEAELAQSEDETALPDRVRNRMILALLVLFREAEDSEKGPARTREMLTISRELSRLRRGDHQQQRTDLLRERGREEPERPAPAPGKDEGELRPDKAAQAPTRQKFFPAALS